ncbi:T9SS type A sorting domain-containing protein [Lacibacter sediminis]|uniref:T9SS type A sorting domain-containing protein n=1 Tax=Lacibacter sediminis TaxID=2760713 RepID=A0A7G5XIF9_9BACT|nr:T9SS type A sorting domain-containing protein [Lacibacter sediminis]QNA45262.1 T9SS type A sorting domain-containing protein [Lacibacter sediminis]
MKQLQILLILLFQITILSAQTITGSVTNSSGLSGTVNNIHFEFNLGESFTSTIGNGEVITQGLLQPITLTQGPLPVLGLEFNAKRINNSKVQLDWKTVQEINNKGFYVERKKETDVNFTQVHFVKSAAPNGNSSLPLNYSHIDMNSLKGKTYYRLKQEDLDGKFMFSIVRMVNGGNGKTTSLKVWPIPSTGPVNISAEGIENDAILVFDYNGRLIKQLTITAKSPVQLTGLAPGTYIVKLSSETELYQKIIIQ